MPSDCSSQNFRVFELYELLIGNQKEPVIRRKMVNRYVVFGLINKLEKYRLILSSRINNINVVVAIYVESKKAKRGYFVV